MNRSDSVTEIQVHTRLWEVFSTLIKKPHDLILPSRFVIRELKLLVIDTTNPRDKETKLKCVLCNDILLIIKRDRTLKWFVNLQAKGVNVRRFSYNQIHLTASYTVLLLTFDDDGEDLCRLWETDLVRSMNNEHGHLRDRLTTETIDTTRIVRLSRGQGTDDSPPEYIRSPTDISSSSSSQLKKFSLQRIRTISRKKIALPSRKTVGNEKLSHSTSSPNVSTRSGVKRSPPMAINLPDEDTEPLREQHSPNSSRLYQSGEIPRRGSPTSPRLVQSVGRRKLNKTTSSKAILMNSVHPNGGTSYSSNKSPITSSLNQDGGRGKPPGSKNLVMPSLNSSDSSESLDEFDRASLSKSLPSLESPKHFRTNETEMRPSSPNNHYPTNISTPEHHASLISYNQMGSTSPRQSERGRGFSPGPNTSSLGRGASGGGNEYRHRNQSGGGYARGRGRGRGRGRVRGNRTAGGRPSGHGHRDDKEVMGREEEGWEGRGLRNSGKEHRQYLEETELSPRGSGREFPQYIEGRETRGSGGELPRYIDGRDVTTRSSGRELPQYLDGKDLSARGSESSFIDRESTERGDSHREPPMYNEESDYGYMEHYPYGGGACWIVIRRYGKRGGMEMDLPHTLSELLSQGSQRLGIHAVSLRHFQNDEEVQDIQELHNGSVICLLTLEEEKDLSFS